MHNSKTVKTFAAIMAASFTLTSFAEVTRAETIAVEVALADIASDQGQRGIERQFERAARNACSAISPTLSRKTLRRCQTAVKQDLYRQLHEQNMAATARYTDHRKG